MCVCVEACELSRFVFCLTGLECWFEVPQLEGEMAAGEVLNTSTAELCHPVSQRANLVWV